MMVPGSRPLRVGLLTHDHFFLPCKTMVRALWEAAEALESLGHEVVRQCEMPLDGWETTRLCYSVMGADGNLHSLTEALDGEELHHTYHKLKSMTDTPNLVNRRLVQPLLKLSGENRLAWVGGCSVSGGASARDYWSMGSDLVDFQKAYMEWMVSNKFDALLLPSTPVPAFTHGSAKDLSPSLSYMFLPNLLQWPAGVVPTTTVQGGEDNYYDPDSLPPNQRDRLAKSAAEQMEGTLGLPVGVQVMTMHNEDELCLHVMKLLEDQLKYNFPAPEMARTCVASSDK